MVQRPDIFVPTPKGAGDSLDNTAAPAAGRKGADTVLMMGGDRVHGKVMGTTADGALRLVAPHFDGEVRVRLAALDRIILIPTEKESVGDIVTLTNEDRVGGKITGMTADAVTVESRAMGALRISRRVIRSLAFSGARETLMEPDFASGSMAPFQKVRGNWSIRDGALFCDSRGSRSTIAAPLEQKDALTVVIDIESLTGENIYVDLILFADDMRNTYGRNSVFAMFTSYDFRIQYCRNGGTNHVANGRYVQNRGVRKGQFRFSYDPAQGKARLWSGNRDLGEWTMPFKPKTGKFVMFNCRQSAKITSIRVLPGVVKPRESVEETQTENDTVVFKNKDHVKVTELTLSDGKFKGKTSFGTLEAPVENVRLVTFGTKNQERPRRRKGDVIVELLGGHVTLQFMELNDQHLLGRADSYGEVQVLRKAIRSVRFNIYR